MVGAQVGNVRKNSSSEFIAFDKLVGKVLSVSREEMLRREHEYREQSQANPRKRGPKPKIK